jgi:hypothetical protein
VHRRASCLEVTATRADGRVETLYTSACPPTGFRWRIDPWDEMVLGLVRRTRVERFVPGAPAPGASERFKLAALGDFFCRSPLAAEGAREEVRLRLESLLVLYSGGRETRDRALRCRWRCADPPLAPPRCEREPAPGRAARAGGIGSVDGRA